MKLSEAQREGLYDAVSIPIIDMRLSLDKGKHPTDRDLHCLQHDIWNRLLEALASNEVPR